MEDLTKSITSWFPFANSKTVDDSNTEMDPTLQSFEARIRKGDVGNLDALIYHLFEARTTLQTTDNETELVFINYEIHFRMLDQYKSSVDTRPEILRFLNVVYTSEWGLIANHLLVTGYITRIINLDQGDDEDTLILLVQLIKVIAQNLTSDTMHMLIEEDSSVVFLVVESARNTEFMIRTVSRQILLRMLTNSSCETLDLSIYSLMLVYRLVENIGQVYGCLDEKMVGFEDSALEIADCLIESLDFINELLTLEIHVVTMEISRNLIDFLIFPALERLVCGSQQARKTALFLLTIFLETSVGQELRVFVLELIDPMLDQILIFLVGTPNDDEIVLLLYFFKLVASLNCNDDFRERLETRVCQLMMSDLFEGYSFATVRLAFELIYGSCFIDHEQIGTVFETFRRKVHNLFLIDPETAFTIYFYECQDLADLGNFGSQWLINDMHSESLTRDQLKCIQFDLIVVIFVNLKKLLGIEIGEDRVLIRCVDDIVDLETVDYLQCSLDGFTQVVIFDNDSIYMASKENLDVERKDNLRITYCTRIISVVEVKKQLVQDGKYLLDIKTRNTLIEGQERVHNAAVGLLGYGIAHSEIADFSFVVFDNEAANRFVDHIEATKRNILDEFKVLI